jgi:pyruvate formate lyase activating enzyme
MLPVTDLFLYDLKCIDPIRHKELTGVDNRLILENLLRLDNAGAKTFLRCPLVPGLNDQNGDLMALKEFYQRLQNMQKLEICPYHPLGIEKYAKFGKPLLYDNPDAADKADVERWKQILYGEI